MGADSLAAVLLAGGKSRRMGTDKALITLRGETLVARAVRTLRSRCSPVVVVRADGQCLGALDACVITDAQPGQGPLVALAQGLRAVREAGVARAFVCAVDMPLMQPELIDELTVASGAVVLARGDDGCDQFLAGIYDTDLCDTIDELVKNGVRRLGALMDSVDMQRITITNPGWVVNVNTAEQWEALAPLL